MKIFKFQFQFYFFFYTFPERNEIVVEVVYSIYVDRSKRGWTVTLNARYWNDRVFKLKCVMFLSLRPHRQFAFMKLNRWYGAVRARTPERRKKAATERIKMSMSLDERDRSRHKVSDYTSI